MSAEHYVHAISKQWAVGAVLGMKDMESDVSLVFVVQSASHESVMSQSYNWCNA